MTSYKSLSLSMNTEKTLDLSLPTLVDVFGATIVRGVDLNNLITIDVVVDVPTIVPSFGPTVVVPWFNGNVKPTILVNVYEIKEPLTQVPPYQIKVRLKSPLNS